MKSISVEMNITNYYVKFSTNVQFQLKALLSLLKIFSLNFASINISDLKWRSDQVQYKAVFFHQIFSTVFVFTDWRTLQFSAMNWHIIVWWNYKWTQDHLYQLDSQLSNHWQKLRSFKFSVWKLHRICWDKFHPCASNIHEI